jgi:hypothetical protein
MTGLRHMQSESLIPIRAEAAYAGMSGITTTLIIHAEDGHPVHHRNWSDSA